MADRSACRLSLQAVLLLGMLMASGGWGLGARPALASELRETAIVKAVRKARATVVNIRGEKLVTPAGTGGTFDAGRRVNGMGTGVIIDERGYVLTNHHVVDGVREIQVTLADGRRLTAHLVARDPETDLAIIKLHADPNERFEVISVGTSADLMPGEPVIAVGNAFGYEHTVTRGIISALGRAVQVSDAQFYEDLIQTEAGTAEHRFRVATRALAACVGAQGQIDPAPWITQVQEAGEELLAKAPQRTRRRSSGKWGWPCTTWCRSIRCAASGNWP